MLCNFNTRLIQVFTASPFKPDVENRPEKESDNGQPEIPPSAVKGLARIQSDAKQEESNNDKVPIPPLLSPPMSAPMKPPKDLPPPIEMPSLVQKSSASDRTRHLSAREKLLYGLERSRLINTLRKEALQTFRMLTEQCFRGLGDGAMQRKKSSVTSHLVCDTAFLFVLLLYFEIFIHFIMWRK